MLSLLRIRLWQTIYPQGDFVENTNVQQQFSNRFDAEFPFSSPEKISLKQVRKRRRIVYSSALSHAIAAHYKLPLEMVVSKIVNGVLDTTLGQHVSLHLLISDPILLDTLVRDTLVQTTTNSLIQFEVGDQAIAAWLDGLVKEIPSSQVLQVLQPTITDRNSIAFRQEVLAAQYAHARCCSLLRLAHREGFATLNQSNNDPLLWQFVTSQAIPWLVETQLCLTHPTEFDLITELFAALDEVCQPAPQQSAKKLLRSTQRLTQAFQQFYSTHQIAGSIRIENSKRLSAQLGLLLATQRGLCLLLRKLNAYAPLEL